MPNATDFNAISIALASSEHVKQWSHGEVTKPETINYRTLRPEKDGLFCERIFGPTKDWECHCGKYKKQRFRGVICDRCGVEVTRANVRRQRMGHVTLAAPVAHIWFAKGIPSRLGLLLDMSPRNLERVLYFAQYVVTKVDPLMRNRKIEELENDHVERALSLEEQLGERVADLEAQYERVPAEDAARRDELQVQIQAIKGSLAEQRAALQEALDKEKGDVESLKPLMLLTESRHRELSDKYGDVFQAGIGAEAIMELLRALDMEEEIARLKTEVRTTSGQRRKKAGKRMEALEAFHRSGNKPEWMVMTALPVLPPDLRPMVQLDGGRFATSDLNDLYRRVINRNNRLKRLLELGAPEIIIRNEKRMLQEAVDDLIDNGRRGRPIVGSHNHQLKSLSDLLRGKQGRFRQNLLGKRVDYGGRSVIVVGPDLKLHECGLPKKMALELFKPFVMNRIWAQGMANNAKSAKRMVERAGPEVWDILEEVIQDRPVLLNRAPTLHRLGIQAFIPRLVEGSAIQLHPLVCAAFNADFDGDQMAVHVPLSEQAVSEARNVMLSKYNMLSPSSGEPLVAPTYEIVLGCYYLTQARPGAKGEGGRYRDFDDVMVAFDAGALDLHAQVAVRDAGIETTPGRVVFNSVLPEETRRYDQVMDKKALRNLVVEIHGLIGNDATADVLDNLKAIGFEYATRSGITIGITDIKVPPEKAGIIAEAEEVVRNIEYDYEMGLLSEQERHARIIGAWQEANGKLDKAVQERLSEFGGIYDMAHSGARGNEAQIKQMAAWRGLMSKPGKSGSDVIEQPVKSSFREGLSVLEYFISTHGARKGLTDTALRTADSGYLTRRLIDVAQEAIIKEEDCGTERGVTIYAVASSDEDVMIDQLSNRIAGRVAASPVADPATGEVLADAGAMIERADAKRIQDAGVEEVFVRSPLTCDAAHGVCKQCYGWSPATGRLARIGDAVGIVAAQSIGEPGTQLTMRTFHMGGVAGLDITTGLPRVEEIFEARVPKGKACIAEIDGKILVWENRQLVGEYIPSTRVDDAYQIPRTYKLSVRDGQWVKVGDIVAGAPKEGPCPVCEGLGRVQTQHHVTLDLPLKATLKDLRQARNEKIKESHPDTNPGPEANVRTVAINKAYEELQNADLRRRGDECNECKGAGTSATALTEDNAIRARTTGTAHVQGRRVEIELSPSEERSEYPELVPPQSFTPVIRVVNRLDFKDPYTIGESFAIEVEDGQYVRAGQVLAVPVAGEGSAKRKDRTEDSSTPNELSNASVDDASALAATAPSSDLATKAAERPAVEPILARVSGTVRLLDGGVEIHASEVELRDHQVDATAQRLVRTGDKVEAGQRLTSGVKDPHDILRIVGMEATLRYFTEQVQVVYRNQGVDINDKHIETIVGRMLRWVKVEAIGDTEFLPNQTVDRDTFQNVNERVLAEGGEPATGKPDIRGVTRASLNTESFLAKASFQETARVLTEAALSGDVDHLRGLKENVIIGRLIPARLDLTEEGRNLLGITDKIPARAPLDDYERLMGLLSNEPGAPFDDDDDDDFFTPRRQPSTIDFSIDDDDDDDDLFLDDEEDDDPLGEPEDSPGEQTPASDSDEEEESEDASAAPDPDDLDPFEGPMAEGSIAAPSDPEEEEPA